MADILEADLDRLAAALKIPAANRYAAMTDLRLMLETVAEHHRRLSPLDDKANRQCLAEIGKTANKLLMEIDGRTEGANAVIEAGWPRNIAPDDFMRALDILSEIGSAPAKPGKPRIVLFVLIGWLTNIAAKHGGRASIDAHHRKGTLVDVLDLLRPMLPGVVPVAPPLGSISRYKDMHAVRRKRYSIKTGAKKAST